MKLNILGFLSLVALADAAKPGFVDTCEKQWNCLTFTYEPVAEAKCTATTGDCKLRVCMHINTEKDGCAKKDTGASISHACDAGDADGCQNSGNFDTVLFDTGISHSGADCTGTIGDGESDLSGKCGDITDLKFCQEGIPGQELHFIVKDGSNKDDDQVPQVFPLGETPGACEPVIDCFNAGSTYSNTTIAVEQSCDGGANLQKMERIWRYTIPGCLDCGSTPTDPPVSNPDPTDPPSGGNGDPHFKTWKNEHFEYHGQCDLVLAKDEKFAGIGLNVQIRTKVIRYWSYIKNAAVRIGDDVLEVEGSADPTSDENIYWYNLEYQGKMETLGGFPVTYKQQAAFKRTFEVDLSSKFPGQKIVISTYKEFVRVDFVGGTEESFGNTVGILGDFKTGKTLARDGSTELSDFWELGNEWQVMPFETMLFHETSEPQFPEKCMMPEDPQGERRRQLAESTVSEAQAEAACAHLKDAADRKDCVYDILATQDLDMVGAY